MASHPKLVAAALLLFILGSFTFMPVPVKADPYMSISDSIDCDGSSIDAAAYDNGYFWTKKGDDFIKINPTTGAVTTVAAGITDYDVRRASSYYFVANGSHVFMGQVNYIVGGGGNVTVLVVDEATGAYSPLPTGPIANMESGINGMVLSGRTLFFYNWAMLRAIDLDTGSIANVTNNNSEVMAQRFCGLAMCSGKLCLLVNNSTSGNVVLKRFDSTAPYALYDEYPIEAVGATYPSNMVVVTGNHLVYYNGDYEWSVCDANGENVASTAVSDLGDWTPYEEALVAVGDCVYTSTYFMNSSDVLRQFNTTTMTIAEELGLPSLGGAGALVYDSDDQILLQMTDMGNPGDLNYLVQLGTPPAPSTYDITASVSGSGGTISPLGVTSVTSGDSQTYTVTASGGYAILKVLIDGANVGGVSSYTFSSVSTTHTIVAYFYSTSGGGGSTGGNTGGQTSGGTNGGTSGGTNSAPASGNMAGLLMVLGVLGSVYLVSKVFNIKKPLKTVKPRRRK